MSTAEIGEIIRSQQAQPSTSPFGQVDASGFAAASQAPGAGRFLNGPLQMSNLFNSGPAQPNVGAIHSLPIDQMISPAGGLLGGQGGMKQRQQPYIPPTPGNFRGLIA